MEATPYLLARYAEREQMREAKEWERVRWLASVCASFSFSGKPVRPKDLLSIPLIDGVVAAPAPLTDKDIETWLKTKA